MATKSQNLNLRYDNCSTYIILTTLLLSCPEKNIASYIYILKPFLQSMAVFCLKLIITPRMRFSSHSPMDVNVRPPILFKYARKDKKGNTV